MAQRAILLAALAAAAPYLYDRYLTMSTMLANHPANYEYSNTFKHSEVKFSDRIRNCEDVLIEEAMGIAFLSCNPGRDQWNTVMGTFVPAPVKKDEKDTANIWIYDYSTPNIPESEALKPLKLIDYPNAADFQPLAIEYEAAISTLYLINHSRNSGNILEVFQVSVKDATAKHVKTLKHPMLPTPNSMHNLGNGKLLVTNDHYFGALTSPLLSKIETFSAVPGGSVVYMDLHNTSAAKTLAHVGFANGITMLNATTVAVASTAKPGVYFYNYDPETITLDYVSHFRVPAAVDNLSVDSKGKLLMAGHPFAFALMAVSKARANCDWNGDEEQKKACELSAPSWVAEWSEEGGLQTVYKDSGAEFGSSTTFARDVGRGVGIVTGLYQRGILVGKV